jgi:hypothetical protein
VTVSEPGALPDSGDTESQLWSTLLEKDIGPPVESTVIVLGAGKSLPIL